MNLIQNDVNLSKLNAFKIGGPARYYIDAKNDQDVIGAMQFAHQHAIPFFVLGSGTNMLISSDGYVGMVIRNQMKELKVEDDLIIAETANTLAIINQFANLNGFVGFEKLATVPGTLGGGLYNNAHWLDDLISNYVAWVECVDPKDPTLKVQRILKEDLAFSYDTSLIKTKNLVALRAGIKLPKGDTVESRKTLLEYLKKRTESQPYGTLNSGCMFQNVPQNLGPGNHGTSAGYLIDQAGLKGMQIGDAKISEKHGNFFINTGNASSDDIIKLAELAREKVKEKFGVNLEYEIKIIN